MSTTVSRVVIIGGGAVAWLAGAGLQRAFRHRQLDVVVIDSRWPNDAPVGWWTLPSQRGMHSLLGINEADVVQRTGASFKLATQHVGWQGGASDFLHVHGDIGSELGGTPFFQYLLMQALAGRRENPEHYCVAALAARLGRFAQPMGDEKALTASFTYGFHFPESEYVSYLRDHAIAMGVRQISGTPAGFTLHDDGNVSALTLTDGRQVAGDYFLDASGPDAWLMSKVADAARDDWSDWLPCDRMLSALASPLTGMLPMTQTTASDAGWLWRAPLARASMAGYVYSSAFTDDDAALAKLRATSPGLAVPVLQKLSPGRRRKFWDRNCIAIGSAAIELEPLAGAELHLAQLGIGTLIELFPLNTQSRCEGREYDRIMGEHADSLLAFTLAHYRAGPAREGEFWDATRRAPSPELLQRKLDNFSANGRIDLVDHESFEEMDWAWLLMGSGNMPHAIELLVRAYLEGITREKIEPMRGYIEKLAASMPRHSDYLLRLASRAPHAKQS